MGNRICIPFPRIQNVAEILNIYENEFNKLSDRYFVELPWPDTEMIAPLIEKGLYLNVTPAYLNVVFLHFA